MKLVSPRFEVAKMPPRLESIANDLGVRAHPKYLRELNEFEAKRREASKAIKVAVKQRMRTKAQIEGIPFYRGILSVDSSSNEVSEIYGAKAREKRETLAKQTEQQELRRERLTLCTSSILSNGNLVVPSSIPESVSVYSQFQSKKPPQQLLSFEDTHRRLFERNQGTTWHSLPRHDERAQHLRDQDLSGKQYNIVTHVLVEQCPSRPLPRERSKLLEHPSQTSLEGSRNVQGILTRV
jgi:hypothetical protein